MDHNDRPCKNCENMIYRAQNYPMDGDWHWLHRVSQDRRCLIFAEPNLT